MSKIKDHVDIIENKLFQFDSTINLMRKERLILELRQEIQNLSDYIQKYESVIQRMESNLGDNLLGEVIEINVNSKKDTILAKLIVLCYDYENMLNIEIGDEVQIVK